MAGVIVSCPKCGMAFSGRLFGITSGLGPPTFQCASCGHLIASGKDEWPRLGFGRRARYVVVSLLYGALLGFLYAIAVLGAYRTAGRIVTGAEPTLTGVLLVAVWAAFGVAVLGVQAYRVVASIRRVAAGREGPARASVNSLASSGLTVALLPAMALVFLSVILGWLF
jgi:hypothetical protein